MKRLKQHLIAGFGSAAALLTMSAVPASADGMPEDPIARFEEPVCPGVIGLQVGDAVAMVARMRENAEAIGLRTAQDGACEPNVVVAFLADGQDYLRRLNDDRSYLFASLDRAQKRDLLDAAGPARAWITTEVRTRDGGQVGRRDNLVAVPQAGMWSAHSLIYVPTRRDITAAMVLIDRGVAGDFSIMQLADYATLYGFAGMVPAAAADTPSIQRLFGSAPVSAPAGLSQFDITYLQRLYDSLPNLPAYVRLEGLEGLASVNDKAPDRSRGREPAD